MNQEEQSGCHPALLHAGVSSNGIRDHGCSPCSVLRGACGTSKMFDFRRQENVIDNMLPFLYIRFTLFLAISHCLKGVRSWRISRSMH